MVLLIGAAGAVAAPAAPLAGAACPHAGDVVHGITSGMTSTPAVRPANANTTCRGARVGEIIQVQLQRPHPPALPPLSIPGGYPPTTPSATGERTSIGTSWLLVSSHWS